MREVRIRDTLSGALQSIDPGHEVGIYACGPTVYSRIHIGNARPFVVFSLFARFLLSDCHGRADIRRLVARVVSRDSFAPLYEKVWKRTSKAQVVHQQTGELRPLP